MAIDLNLSDFLISPTGRSPQREFFNCTKRNQCMSGGFGSGKTYIACKKVIAFCLQFPNSRWVIGRNKYTDLMRTTVPTFFKVCPEAAIKGATKEKVEMVNGSIIYFMHFSDLAESVIRGLELDGAYVDQAEEMEENIALLLSTRIGRWDKAIVPQHLLDQGWKNFDSLGNPRVPPYYIITVNPDSELHWVYRRFHPESIEHQLKYKESYEMIQCSTLDNPTIDKEIIAEMMSRDEVFIDRFVYGKWGISESAIHRVQKDSILTVGTSIGVNAEGYVQVTAEWIENFLHRARLFRAMDHGDSAPTCCLWFASWNGIYICYREYYQPEKTISYHRKAIQELSISPATHTPEYYSGNYADPDIFKLHSQKAGIRFSVSDEYIDTVFLNDSKPISWQKGSNDEFGTRNRINECLHILPTVTHPVTNQKGAPRLYFIQKGEFYANGCFQSILQLKAQKRVQIGSENGKPIFTDDRDENVTDHAYDPIRYFISIHHNHNPNVKTAAPPGSFFASQKEAKKLKLAGKKMYAY
jgi:hypothetical protein